MQPLNKQLNGYIIQAMILNWDHGYYPMADCRLRRMARSSSVYNYRWTNNKLKATPNPKSNPKPIP